MKIISVMLIAAIASCGAFAETIGRYTYVTAEVVDAKGTVCPYADRDVDFGEKAVATCSGDLSDNVVATSRVRRTWMGRCRTSSRKKGFANCDPFG